MERLGDLTVHLSRLVRLVFISAHCPRLCILSPPLHLLTQGSLSCLAMELYHF